MQRRRFLTTTGLAGAAAAFSSSFAAASAQTNSAAPAADLPLVDGTPAVYAPTATGATVVWTVRGMARGWVEYGETQQLGQVCRSDSFGFVPHDGRVLKVRLQGLKPGVRYYWHTVTASLTGGEPITSPVYSFRTLNPGATETRFAMWNDTHDRAETLRKLRLVTPADSADFLIWNGDLSNNAEKPDVLPGLYVHPSGVNLAEVPPILLCRGNHDVRGLYAGSMERYVDFPSGGPFCAFRSGPLAVIQLDTGEDKPDQHPSFRGLAAFEPLIQEQKRWLAEVIQRPEIQNAPYRIATCHIPLRAKTEGPVDYDKGGFDLFSRRGREAWEESLVRWKVQAVVSGHMHRWARIPRTAEHPYDQIIGGGPEVDKATLIRGEAGAQQLRIAIQNLDGKELDTATYSPLAT